MTYRLLRRSPRAAARAPRRSGLAAVAAVAAIVACGSATILGSAMISGSAMAGGGGLDGNWRIVAVDGKPVPKDSGLKITFKDATISGFAGCNTFKGPYMFHGTGAQTVTVGPLRTTRKACAAPVMTLENAILRDVGTAHQINRADDGSVVFTNETGKITLRIEQVFD